MLCFQGWDAEEAIDRSLQALFILNGRYMKEVEELRQAQAAHTDRQDIAFPIGEFWGPGVMPMCTLIPCKVGRLAQTALPQVPGLPAELQVCNPYPKSHAHWCVLGPSTPDELALGRAALTETGPPSCHIPARCCLQAAAAGYRP